MNTLSAAMMTKRLKMIGKAVKKIEKQKLKQERLAMRIAIRDMKAEFEVAEATDEDYNF